MFHNSLIVEIVMKVCNIVVLMGQVIKKRQSEIHSNLYHIFSAPKVIVIILLFFKVSPSLVLKETHMFYYK